MTAITFEITAAESQRFARLSGDFNPLHLDDTVARRTQYGGTVVHGVHLVLRALDVALARYTSPVPAPVAISAKFNNPVLTGAAVSIRVTVEDGAGKLRLAAESQGRVSFSLVVSVAVFAPVEVPDIQSGAFTPSLPLDVEFPPQQTDGSTALRLDTGLLYDMFPNLARCVDTSWIADLLATTRVIGMECPGRHSIYSGFKLKRIEDARTRSAARFDYRIRRSDERFRMLTMDCRGASLAGPLETFFRPLPVDQMSVADILQRVAPGSFRGQRALIVGGSRGLGELTSKLVAAGGGDVVITYARGRADADRVCEELSRAALRCAVQPLDVLRYKQLTGDDGGPDDAWLAAGAFTHVYYFASPAISRNPTRDWDAALFERFAEFYVDAFALLALRLVALQPESPPAFLYPSSIFVAEPEQGFAEYACAKGAGEALCTQLAARSGARFEHPRLPRMRTDQTIGLVDNDALDPFPIIHRMLRDLTC